MSITSGKWTVDASVPPVLLTLRLLKGIGLHLKLSDEDGELPTTCKVTSKLFEVPDGRLLWSDETELDLDPMVEYGLPHEAVAHMVNPFVAYYEACLRQNRQVRLGKFTVDIDVLLQDGALLRITGLPFEVRFGPIP